jgi:hypothetical protein
VHSNQQDPAQADWIRLLCLECGLCCNGVLFADVRLGSSDDALALAKAGLKLVRRRGAVAFDQPCACLRGSFCSIYQIRPARCRAFDCHTLKQARAGEVTSAAALRRIRQARVLSQHVRALLEATGHRDVHRPLSRRYQDAMSRPIDLSAGDEDAEVRGELMLAVNDLMNRLHRDFLQP